MCGPECQGGYSLPGLMRDYGTEEQCRQALFQWRWPKGYICTHCESTQYCRAQVSSHLPVQSLPPSTIINQWHYLRFNQAASNHLVSSYLTNNSSKTGLSALALRRQLGVSYNTAWAMKQKIMQVMKERDDSRPLTGVIQLDDVYWGGEHHGGKPGRGSPNKTPFVAAVSSDVDGHPQRMNMNVVKGFRLKEIERWEKRHLTPNSHVVSDGLACFTAVTKAQCKSTGGGPACVSLREFTWVNTMIGNVKNAITGVYHSIDHRHLPRYLAEYRYRFNRRFDLTALLPRFCYVALRTPSMPARLLSLAEG